MLFKLETRSPLWFGGLKNDSDARFHQTGIIGSLRWWYEAVVRGLGGYACDPSDAKCRVPKARLEVFGWNFG